MVFCSVRGSSSVLGIGTDLIDTSKPQELGKNPRPFIHGELTNIGPYWAGNSFAYCIEIASQKFLFNFVLIRYFSLHDNLKYLKLKCFLNSCQKHVSDFKLSRFTLFDGMCSQCFI